jgi:16S rRNA (cytosine967-C5)-methyltransferase
MDLSLLKIVSGEKPREIAAQTLLGRTRPGAPYVEDILEKALASARLPPSDRGLARELVCGVVRWQATLDWLIARKTAGRQQKPMLEILLQLGLYQIFWLDRIPDHAAVHETVESARRAGFGPQTGFVNAVLRGYLREHEATRDLLAGLAVSQPHLGYSHPEWLVSRWLQRYGAENATHLLQWNNTPPPVYARVNTLKIDPGALLEQWRQEGVEYDLPQRDWFEQNLVFELKAHPSLADLPSFKEGWFYIQDPSTLVAVRELNPQPGERILDFCAAPGGKTTYIAQQVRDEAEIVAQDITPERIQLVQENCARLGVTSVKTVFPETHSSGTMSYDRVLVDAPCTNTGVLRRRVDLRWRIRPEEIQRLRRTQRDVLFRAAPFVKHRGTLVYSTCSLEPEENGELVEEFLRQHPEFRLLNSRDLLPFRDKVDGAFVATLVRS